MHFCQTRHKFIYDGSVTIRNSGDDDSIEGVFGIILVFEVLATQKVVEMLAKEIVGG